MARAKALVKAGGSGLWGLALLTVGLLVFFLMPMLFSRGGQKGFVPEAHAQCSFSSCTPGESACTVNGECDHGGGDSGGAAGGGEACSCNGCE